MVTRLPEITISSVSAMSYYDPLDEIRKRLEQLENRFEFVDVRKEENEYIQ